MKIVAFSDCHWLYKDIKEFPEADLCIFAGDWCGSGESLYETACFANWFGNLPYKYKVAIPGNHDIFCENNVLKGKVLASSRDYSKAGDVSVATRNYGDYSYTLSTW